MDPLATVKIPRELATAIDNFIEESPLGYRSRAEVVVEATRRFLREEAHVPSAVEKMLNEGATHQRTNKEDD